MATFAYEPSADRRSRFRPLPPGDSVMLFFAAFAILWAVMRACHQSITMDEAMTWRSYVAPADPNHWTAHSNNHVLNSILMRLAIAAFGLSELSVRLPALAGACVYIGSCFCLCRLLFEEALARLLVFVCLFLNPYLGDFFAAARGYSLAFGFLVCAIALVADLQLQLPGAPPAKAARVCALVSAVLGLSFVANFSYAIIDGTTWAALLLWVLLSQWPSTNWRERRQLLVAGILPGAFVAFVLASATLLDWNREQLFDGAHSLAEMKGRLATGALAEPNPEVANRLVLSAAEFLSDPGAGLRHDLAPRSRIRIPQAGTEPCAQEAGVFHCGGIGSVDGTAASLGCLPPRRTAPPPVPDVDLHHSAGHACRRVAVCNSRVERVGRPQRQSRPDRSFWRPRVLLRVVSSRQLLLGMATLRGNQRSLLRTGLLQPCLPGDRCAGAASPRGLSGILPAGFRPRDVGGVQTSRDTRHLPARHESVRIIRATGR